jgi:hypothetical protein
VVILVVGLLNVVGTVYEGAKVRAKLADLKAKGVAVSWTELIPKAVPAEENAAPLYLKAADMIKARDEAAKKTAQADGQKRVERYGYDSKDWSDPARMAVVGRFVQEDADALDLIKEAAARPSCWFNLNWSDPISTLFPHLAKMRNLARFVGSAAIVASAQGNQGEALGLLRLGFVIPRHLSPEPTLIDQLVCYAIEAIMARAAEKVLAGGPIPEDKARALVEELGRIDYMTTFNQAMQMERCFGLHLFDQLRGHSVDLRSLVGDSNETGLSGMKWLRWGYAYLLRPLTYADERCYLDAMDSGAKTMAMPARESVESRAAMSRGSQAPWYAVLTRILQPVFSKAVVKRDQTMAQRALVGAAMGVEMYKQKVGRYPAGLAEVRQTGWKVAEDPFSGKELVYRVVGPTYLLYSIGQDLKDDGGKPMWYQLGSLGRGAGHEGGGLQDKGDIVWIGTWEAARKALGR